MRKWQDDPNSKWTAANHYILFTFDALPHALHVLRRHTIRQMASSAACVPLVRRKGHIVRTRLCTRYFGHRCIRRKVLRHPLVLHAGIRFYSTETPPKQKQKKKRRVNCKTKRKKYPQGHKNKKNNKITKQSKETNKTSNKGEKKETILNTTKNEEMKWDIDTSGTTHLFTHLVENCQRYAHRPLRPWPSFQFPRAPVDRGFT